MEQEQSSAHSALSMPVAVVVAGVLIAGAVLYRGSPRLPGGEAGVVPPISAPSAERAENIVRPVGADDHFLGNPDAPVIIVEYSDLECPFCKQFHAVLQEVMEEYGKEGKVAWVYRHFPLTNIHPKAHTEAVASECAAAQGGNELFWAYIERIFAITPSNNQLDLALLPEVAEELGLERGAFEACLASGVYDAAVNEDYQDAVASGARGTPYSIILNRGGVAVPITGSQPIAVLRAAIQQALENE